MTASNLSTADWVVLPISDGLALHSFAPNTAAPVAQLALPDSFQYDLRHDRFALLEAQGKRLTVYSLGDNGIATRTWSPMQAPAGFHGRCVLLHNNVVYVGGYRAKKSASSDGSCLYVVDQDGWRELHEPKGGMSKHIDGLAMRGMRLIAVDDFVLPKWNFVFDATVAAAPIFQNKNRLPAHTSYERVLRTTFDANWLALWSRGINHGNESAHLSILNIDSLEEAAQVAFACHTPGPHDDQTAIGQCTGLVLHRDTLFALIDGTLQIYALPGSPETDALRATHRRKYRALAQLDAPETAFSLEHLCVSASGMCLYAVGRDDQGRPMWMQL